jgi:hypothetical protein
MATSGGAARPSSTAARPAAHCTGGSIRGTGDPNPAHGDRAFLATRCTNAKRKLAALADSLGLQFQIDRRCLLWTRAELGGGPDPQLRNGRVGDEGRRLLLSQRSLRGQRRRRDRRLHVPHGGAAVRAAFVGEECVLGAKSACLGRATLGNTVTRAPFACVRRLVPTIGWWSGIPAASSGK